MIPVDDVRCDRWLILKNVGLPESMVRGRGKEKDLSSVGGLSMIVCTTAHLGNAFDSAVNFEGANTKPLLSGVGKCRLTHMGPR